MQKVEHLIDVGRLRELLQQGTGEGVRVAVIDTGVEGSHPELEGSVKTFQEIVSQGRTTTVRPTQPTDLVGHGTACAGIIHRIAPGAELHSMRVIGTSTGGSLQQLIRGIEWAVDEKMDIVNLSLGTVSSRQVPQLLEVIERAYFSGSILIAAGSNRQATSYPASAASLVGVDFESLPDPLSFRFRLGLPVEIVAHGTYVLAPAPGGKSRYFTGTSFACPHISGLAARLRSVMPNLAPCHLKTLLWCLRCNAGDCD